MTDRDLGVAALLLFICGWIAPYLANYFFPARSRERAAITGVLVGAGILSIAGAVAFLAGRRFPLPLFLLLICCVMLLGLLYGLRGFLNAPKSYDGRKFVSLGDPFYKDLMEGEKPADFDREGRQAVLRDRLGGFRGGGAYDSW